MSDDYVLTDAEEDMTVPDLNEIRARLADAVQERAEGQTTTSIDHYIRDVDSLIAMGRALLEFTNEDERSLAETTTKLAAADSLNGYLIAEIDRLTSSKQTLSDGLFTTRRQLEEARAVLREVAG